MKLLVEPLIMNAVGQNLIVKSVLQGYLNHLFAGFWDGELLVPNQTPPAGTACAP
jgi:hypothetical protein